MSSDGIPEGNDGSQDAPAVRGPSTPVQRLLCHDTLIRSAVTGWQQDISGPSTGIPSIEM